MGKATGFMEYERKDAPAESPKERICHFHEFHTPLSQEEQRIQSARCMDCGVPFCQYGGEIAGMTSGCPLGNLVPEWNDLLYCGNMDEAWRRLEKTNCFPEFTSRVCPALCEAACTCNVNGKPVASKANEYAIVSHAWESGLIEAKPPKVRTGKKVAVVGSGPAGLAAAELLNKRGHSVTVFERSDRAGGLLMYGIPNMKLEKEVVQRRIRLMQEEGVVFETGVDASDAKVAARLKKDFERVILACGASRPRDIAVAGRELSGIYFAVDFLSSVTKSLLDSNLQDGKVVPVKGKRVLVIGGGDTGNDCVGTAIRLGAKSVLQLEMMPKPPKTRAASNLWPEWPRVEKTDYGQEEAIAVFGKDPRVYETTVTEFVANKKGEVAKAKLARVERKQDASGRFVMAPVAGSETVVDVDLVLIAAGFLGAQKEVADAFGVKLNERCRVETKNAAYETTVSGVFCAGDMRRGQSLVVWAIREGREAARAVDASLMGYTNLE